MQMAYWAGWVLIQFMAEANSFWTASKTDSVQELPRTQTSLSRCKFERKERREGQNRRKPSSHGLLRFDNSDAHFELAFVRDAKNEAPGEEAGSGSIRGFFLCKWQDDMNTCRKQKKNVENN